MHFCVDAILRIVHRPVAAVPVARRGMSTVYDLISSFSDLSSEFCATLYIGPKRYTL